MGLFDRMKEAAARAEGAEAHLKSAGSLGSVPIPGEAEIELPAGEVRVTYEHRLTTMVDERAERLSRWPEVEVEIEDLEFVRHEKSASVHEPSGLRRTAIGAVAVREAGSYKVRASAEDEFYSRRGLEPKLLFG